MNQTNITQKQATVSSSDCPCVDDENASFQQILFTALEKYLQGGRIIFIMPEKIVVVGDHSGTAVEFNVNILQMNFFRKVVCDGHLGLQESFAAGDFYIEENNFTELSLLLRRNQIDQRIKADFNANIDHWI